MYILLVLLTYMNTFCGKVQNFLMLRQSLRKQIGCDDTVLQSNVQCRSARTLYHGTGPALAYPRGKKG